MKKIGLIGAMDEEVAIIKEEMTNTNEVTKAGMTFVEGDFYGLKTVAVVSGIGKVNMAVCTQILCDDFHVTMVINTGVAGSLNNALDIGDIVLSNTIWTSRHSETRSASSHAWNSRFLQQMRHWFLWQNPPAKKQIRTFTATLEKW